LITLNVAGTYSKVSDISSAMVRNLSEPHSGQISGAAKIISSLDKFAGSLIRPRFIFTFFG
jgi:hypothetical protein